MELREKIVGAILTELVRQSRHGVHMPDESAAPDSSIVLDGGFVLGEVADAIMAIPELRDALSFQASSAALTKAAMGAGRYEKRGDFMVWVRDGDEAIEQPQADY